MDGAFSIGFKYDYWRKYKYHSNPEIKIRNELYIDKLYDNFKDEIYQYRHEMSIKTFKQTVMVKVEQYMQSDSVKRIKCPRFHVSNLYQIEWRDAISKDHIISVILYTDYTNLSSNFSSSFRKHGPFDCYQAAKNRNRKYWWWSKYLTETVQVFGANYFQGLRGPFYSGMSMVLKIPEFNIRLVSPTSTTLHIEVAVKFSGQQGIIIKMDNSKVGPETKAMDVSWLSRYSEEEERYNESCLFLCL